MTLTQKRTLVVLLMLGIAYFCLFLFPNSLGAQTEGMLSTTSIDEPVTYPYVVRMLTPAKDFKDLYSRWVIYGDYHYGYPFYFFSALVVLPVELVYGEKFTNFTGLNLLLLRQLISVLPMILAAGLITFLQTRFRSLWKSVLLFLLILSIRGIVRSEIQWWHPDALSVLAVVATIYFLERDQLRFQRNFWFAAAASAFAISIKLAGVFFAPLIALILLAGLLKKKLTLGQAAAKAAIFLVVMLLTLLITNPFLLNSGAREEMIHIQTYKTEELAQGYTHDNPYYYQKGPEYWAWTLESWYASPLLLGFFFLALLYGCFRGERVLLNRFILAWIIPYSIYLFWFVSVKPDHYWLPVMLLLYSAGLNFWDALTQPLMAAGIKLQRGINPVVIFRTALLLILLAHIGENIFRPFSGIVVRYQEGLQIESSAPKPQS